MTDPSSSTESVRPLLSAGAIAGRVGQMGREITQHDVAATAASDDEQPLVVLVVMTGGLVFGADLIRQIDRPLHVGVLHARSYPGRRTTAGELSLATDMLPDLSGRRVLVVDDIFDTGATLAAIVDEVTGRGAVSVETAVLLHKQVEHRTPQRPTWAGFTIADEFVVGYGLDFDGRYRNLPHVGVLQGVGDHAD